MVSVTQIAEEKNENRQSLFCLTHSCPWLMKYGKIVMLRSPSQSNTATSFQLCSRKQYCLRWVGISVLSTYRVKNSPYDLPKHCYSLPVNPWKCKFSMFHYLNFGSIPSLELDLSILICQWSSKEGSPSVVSYANSDVSCLYYILGLDNLKA